MFGSIGWQARQMSSSAFRLRPRAIVGFALFVGAAALLSACGSSASDEPLTVFAASSLTDVLPAIAEDFTASGGPEIELSFAGSSALREQLLDGAPADVFISASPSIVAELAQVGLIDGALSSIARNQLQIAVPTGNPAGVEDISALADNDLFVGLCAREVPCGALGEQVLESADVVADVDTFEPNARSLLAKVELGEVDVALVYSTDVSSSESVEGIELPEGQSAETIYVGVVLTGSESTAADFVSFLATEEALERFSEDGFGRP